MKKAILTAALTVCAQFIHAQVPTWLWGRGGNSSTGALCESYTVATDDSDNVCYAGWYQDSVSFVPYNLTTYNQGCFVAKYTSAGNILWAKGSYALGTGGANGQHVSTDINGNVYVTGTYTRFVSFDSHVLDSVSYNNTFIVKYDTGGNVVWAINTPDNGNQMGYLTNVVDASGNIYEMGYFQNPALILGTDTILNAGPSTTSDIFIIKYDSSGNIIWTKGGNGENTDYAHNIAIDVAGNFYIAGLSRSNNFRFGQDTIHNSLNAAYIVKFDSAGQMIWYKTFSPYSIGWYSIAIDSQNNIYLAGTISASTTIQTVTLVPPAANASLLVKFDSNGNVIWAKCGGGQNNAFGVVVDSQGNPYILGSFLQNNISFDTVSLSAIHVSPWLDPIYVVKYDSSGNALWGKTLASGGDDVCAIAIGPTNNIYIGADYTQYSLIVGNDTLANTHFGEYPYVAKLGYPSAEGIAGVQGNNNYVLFPNPCADRLQVDLKENAASEITIYDMTGRNLLEKKFIQSATLNTEKLASGIYIYKLVKQNGKETISEGKIIKQ
jgi:hypothetical protein